MGGSCGSTIASMTTGPRVAKAWSRMRPQSFGSVIVNPVPPHARANAAKSIGVTSQTFSGFPRNTICSYLIWPSELLFTTTILIGNLYLTAGENYAISIANPPSPTNPMHSRSRYATWAAIVYGKPFAIVVRFPDSEYVCPRVAGMCRAYHELIVPASPETSTIRD